MNKSAAAAAAFVAAALLFSCASAPAAKAPVVAPASAPAATPAPAPAAAEPAKAPEKKRPRIVVVRIPLEIKSSVLFSDGSLDSYAVSERDDAGLLLSQTRFTASGTPIEKTVFAYENGKMVSKEISDGEGKVTSRRAYAYGPHGEVTEETLSDAAGKQLSGFVYAYDGNGKRVSWIVKDAKNAPIAETVYTYADGKLKSAELRDGLGRTTGSSSCEYDGGRLVKQSFFDARGSLVRIETSEWKEGKLVREERKTAGGATQQRTEYEYGPDGEILKRTVEDVVGKSKLATTYEYSFKEESRTIQD